jgi:hypothetical protein
LQHAINILPKVPRYAPKSKIDVKEINGNKSTMVNILFVI